MNRILIDAENAIRARRQHNEDVHEQKLAALFAADNALKEAFYAKKALIVSLSKNRAFGNLAKAKADEEALAASEKKISERLSAHGLDESALSPSWSCPLCEDRGVKDGIRCQCLEKEIRARILEQSNLGEQPLLRFSDCDLSRFDEENREKMTTLYAKMQSYVSRFPQSRVKTFVFSGAPATGKTHLAKTMFSELVLKEVNAVFLSAFELGNAFLKFHTTFEENKNLFLDVLLESEAVFLDDLGTEPILKNVTLPYLYSFVAERTSRGLLTVITTNLSPAQLQARYGERITSRLFDKAHALFVPFENASDLRIGK